MIKELNLKCPYKIFKDTENQVYFFNTKANVKYILYLTSAENHFKNFHLGYNVYEFGFEPEQGKRKNDKNIKLTIIAFLEEFFKNNENVLIFVADISDLKQIARNRLFNSWKNLFDKNLSFDKYNIEIESDNDIYYCSMILRKDNIHKEEYKKAFLLSAKEYEAIK